MKKLMVLLGAAVCAVGVQAASINWTISNVYSVGDSTAKGDGYSAYLFITDNSSNVSGLTVTTLAAVTAALGGDDWATTVAGLSSAHQTMSNGTFVTQPTGISSDFASGSVSAFAVVFDSDDIATANNYYLVNDGGTKTVSFTSSTGAKNFAFGSQATGSADSSKWAATPSEGVPEPTSGLLMLCGLAGLALRRKRA